MTGLYTLDSAALHARLGLLAALASARKNLMLLPSGGGSGAALQRLQLVGEIARIRKELGEVADEGRDERISADEAARLFSDLQRLNADPEWSGGDGHRYEFVAKRIDAASEGRPDAVRWAREWLSELISRVDEVPEQEVAAQSERDAASARYAAEVAAGRSGNPLFQAWLDTLEDPASAKNYQYIIWNSERGAEFDKLWTGKKRALNGNLSSEYRQAREAYFRQWADDHLSERVKAQRAAQAEGETLASHDAEASPPQAALAAAKAEFETHNEAMKAGSVTPDGRAERDRYMAAWQVVEAGEKAEAWEAAKLREIPAANNAKHFIPKAEALTPAGALKADATNSRAGSSVWYYQGDVQALSFTASVTIGGEPHQFAEQAKAILAGIKAARERGFRLYNYRAGRLGTVWVLERDKVFMTRAGLESAANPVFDRPDMPPSAAGYENMLAQQTALAKSFATWLDTLPAEQRHARGVVTAKLRSTTAGEWADIQPDSHGGVLLQYRDEAGKPGIRIAGKDFDDMVAKARELAMMPEVEPAASPAAEAPEPAGEAPPATDPVASLPVTDAPAAAQSVAEVVVEHTTAKGKVLRGVVRHGLTLAEAQKVDKYTFRKDGGYFIRERYLQQPEAAHEPADSPLEQQGRDLPSTGERDLEYIAAGKIESPSQGLINSAKARKEAAFAQLKIVRERVKNGNSNRLDLMKAEFAHKDAVRDLDKAYEQLEKDANRQGLTTIKGRETENTRDNAAADLPQAKRRNRPLEYTGYSGQARSVKSYYEAGGYRIAKPHEGLFEVIDQDGQAIHQMAGLGGALSVVQRLVAGAVLDDASGADLLLDATSGMDRLALLAELRRAMDALAAADDPVVRLDLLVEVARLRKALGTGADAPVVELTGDELGDFPDTPEGKKALRQAAIEELTKLRGTWLDCPALGAQVEIRKRGIDKIKSASADPLKLKIIPRIREILASATRIGRKPNYDIANSPSTAAYHTLRARVRVAGLERQVRIVVTEDDKGLFHYDHTLHEEDAILDSAKSEGPADAEPSGLMGGNLGFTRDLRAAPGATSLLPPELSGEHQPDLRIAEQPLVLNLFIEGEPPGPAE